MFCAAAHGEAERQGHLRIHGNSWARRTRARRPEGLVADRANGAGREGLDADEDAERNDDGPHVQQRVVSCRVSVVARPSRLRGKIKLRRS